MAAIPTATADTGGGSGSMDGCPPPPSGSVDGCPPQLPPTKQQKEPPQKKQKLEGDEFDSDQQQQSADDGGSDSYYDYDEEDDRFYNDGHRCMTKEEAQSYNEVVGLSDGFDAIELPEILTEFGLIRPMKYLHENPKMLGDVKSCSIAALANYNTKNDTKFEFSKVLKANILCVSGSVYYITFEAQNATDQSHQIFEALVYMNISHEIEVELCRVKTRI